jgi:Leucine-rich repeat (LRR) protein
MAFIRLHGYSESLKNSIQQYDTVTLDRVSFQDLTQLFLIFGHIKTLSIYNYNGKQLPPLASLQSVETLELIRMNSISSIPDDIGSLPNLKTLHIFATECTLPVQLRNLKNLESLSVSGIHLTTDFPKSLAGLTQLKKMRISECMGVRIEQLPVALPNVEELDVNNCKELLNVNFLQSFPGLKKLTLFNNTYLSAFPQQFSHLTALQELWIKAEVNVSQIPSFVCALTSLQSLHIYSSRYERDATFTIASEIGQLKNLKELTIEHSGATTRLPYTIGDLSELEQLRLDIQLSHLPESIGRLRKLKRLDVRGRLVSLPEQIGEMDALELLLLRYNRLTHIPAQIGQLKNLKQVELCGNPIQSLPEEIGACENLEDLSCSNMMDSLSLLTVPESIGKLSKLTKLKINGIFAQLPESIGDLKMLKELDLHGNRALTTLPDAIGNCTSLKKIFASHSGIRTLPTALYRLTKLWDVSVQETPAQFAPNKLDRDFFECLNFASTPDGKQQPLEDYKRQAYLHIYLNNFLHEKLDIPQNLFFEGMQLRYEPLRTALLANVFAFNTHQVSLKEAPLKKGDVVAVVGNVAYKKTEIKNRLTEAGITYRSTVTEDVTHLVVGTSPKLPENVPTKDYFLFNERELTDYLNQLETPFLLSAPVANNESVENLIQLLHHPDPVNEGLALQMLEGLGVPSELWTDLLVIAKCSIDADNRSKARQLLKKNTRDAAIMAALAHRGQLADPKKGRYDSTGHNIWKYAQEIKDLDWVSVAYLLWVKHENDAGRYFMQYSQLDDPRRKTYLEKVQHTWISPYKEIDIKMMLTGQEVGWFLNANADKLSEIKELSLNGNHLDTLPIEVYKIKSLLRLKIKFSKVNSLSDEIGQLTQLQDMLLISDNLTHLPLAITQLPLRNVTIKKHTIKNLEEIKGLMPACIFTEA